MKNRDVVLKMSDWHVPFEDAKAVRVALDFAKHLEPDILIIDEVMDWYQVSRFDKDPKRLIRLQEDLDKTIYWLGETRKACPKARIIMVESNHDTRLVRFKRSMAPALESLRNLTVPCLLELGKFNIEYRKDFVFRDVLFKHGDIVRKSSGYTAKGEFEREGCSGVSGHTHRLGMHFVTLRGGKYVWMEGGCLCKTTGVEYIKGVANWQQGISAFIFKKNSRHFHPVSLPIIEHQILWGSETFSK
jgi:hypothetical protein